MCIHHTYYIIKNYNYIQKISHLYCNYCKKMKRIYQNFHFNIRYNFLNFLKIVLKKLFYYQITILLIKDEQSECNKDRYQNE